MELHGYCQKGDECTFAHCPEELQNGNAGGCPSDSEVEVEDEKCLLLLVVVVYQPFLLPSLLAQVSSRLLLASTRKSLAKEMVTVAWRPNSVSVCVCVCVWTFSREVKPVPLSAGGPSSSFSLATTKTLNVAGDIEADHFDVPAHHDHSDQQMFGSLLGFVFQAVVASY